MKSLSHYLRVYSRRKAVKNFSSQLYETDFGVKSNNSIINQQFVNRISRKSKVQILEDISELHFSTDGLKDECTQLDLKITDSKHFDLVEALYNGKSIKENHYIQAAKTGKLDFREAHDYGLTFYQKRFKIAQDKLYEEKTEPILVIEIDNKKYLIDGKHRACLSILMDRKITFKSIGNVLFDSFHHWIYQFMQSRNPIDYQKHINFYERIFEHGNK